MRGSNVQGYQQYKGKLQGLSSDNGGIINPETRGENPWEYHDIDMWGGCWRRGGRDVYGFIPTRPDIGGMTGGGVPGKVTQLGQAPQKIHIHELEVQDSHTEGVPITNTVVYSLRHAYAIIYNVEAQTYHMVRHSNINMAATQRCRVGPDIRVDVVQSAWDIGGRTGVIILSIKIPGNNPVPIRQ